MYPPSPALRYSSSRRKKNRIASAKGLYYERYVELLGPWCIPGYKYDLKRLRDVLSAGCKPSVVARVTKFLMARSRADRRVLCHALGIPLGLNGRPLL